MSTLFQSVSRRKGGLRSIKMVDVNQLLECQFDTLSGGLVSFTLNEGSEFCNICYKETSASYKETITNDKGCARVKHELGFDIVADDISSSGFIAKLISGAITGVIAKITDNNSRCYLVGLSADFGAELPLKMQNVSSDTNSEFSSYPLLVVSLTSEDNRRALELIT